MLLVEHGEQSVFGFVYSFVVGVKVDKECVQKTLAGHDSNGCFCLLVGLKRRAYRTDF